MKLILITLALLASVAAHAQSTNVTVNISVDTGSGAQVVSFAFPSEAIDALVEAHATNTKNRQSAGQAPLLFRQFVRQELADRLRSLTDEGIRRKLTTAKLDTFQTTIQEKWSTMTQAERDALIALQQKYGQ